MTDKSASSGDGSVITLKEFLEDYTPGSEAIIEDLVSYDGSKLSSPTILVHCSHEACGRPMHFDSVSSADHPMVHQVETDLTVRYCCRNCRQGVKVYALTAKLPTPSKDTLGWVRKVGEFPPFGPPLPARLLSLVGDDREILRQGRRSENQGLGIGAFSYYRRVVENQRVKILDTIIAVAERTTASGNVIERLKTARVERQFKKSIELVGDAIPPAILINGQNPLTMLHRALSAGLHGRSDEECLADATAIRVVLSALAERSAEVLKDEQELKDAVSRLTNPGKSEES